MVALLDCRSAASVEKTSVNARINVSTMDAHKVSHFKLQVRASACRYKLFSQMLLMTGDIAAIMALDRVSPKDKNPYIIS